MIPRLGAATQASIASEPETKWLLRSVPVLGVRHHVLAGAQIDFPVGNDLVPDSSHLICTVRTEIFQPLMVYEGWYGSWPLEAGVMETLLIVLGALLVVYLSIRLGLALLLR